MTGVELSGTAEQPDKDVYIEVNITGAGQAVKEGETVVLTADLDYNGDDEVEFMWFADNRQAGENSNSFSISSPAYSQLSVRIIVKAGKLIAEDSVIVQWSGNVEFSGNRENLPGSVMITSVSPDRYLVDGVRTEFTVRLSYSFPEGLSGDLKVIFNNGAKSTEFRVHDRISLPGGTGEHEFIITAVPVDWTETDDFFLYVLLSADGFKTGLSDRKVLEFR